MIVLSLFFVLSFEKGTAMSEIVIAGKEVLREWEKFRSRIFPPEEQKKDWAQASAKWSNLPETEQRLLPELTAFVQQILDSRGEYIPGIFDKYPADLKRLLIFRLVRAGEFLQNFFQERKGLKIPAEPDPATALQNFFHDLLLFSPPENP
jgi:hypothetical protein